MTTRQKTRGRRASAGVAAAAIVGAGLAALPTTAAVAVPASTGGECRLAELPAPAGGYDAGVIDIEVVDGETVYYGNYHIRDTAGREHQRAVIWRGLHGDPEPVDPGLGRFADIALELTASGLVNGVSEDEDQGDPAPWVMDLDTGQVTLIDTTPGAAIDGSDMWVRRINDAGAVVGSDSPGVGAARNVRAYGWAHFSAAPERLEAAAPVSMGWGINDLGDRSGMIAKDKRPGTPHWTDYDPTVWRADGTVVELDRVGIDAIAQLVKNDRTAAGEGWWGWDTATGHVEAVYWRSFDEAIGLGVLDGGGWSRAFGLDEGGWAVGAADRFVPEDNPHGEWGTVFHSFLYLDGTTQEGHVRILPSLYAVEHGVEDWREWYGSAVHGVNSELDQAASGSHAGYDDNGSPQSGATVYLNASSCGVEVETTHDPWHLTDLETARAASEETASLD